MATLILGSKTGAETDYYRLYMPAATALEVYSLLLPNLASWQSMLVEDQVTERRETMVTKVLARSHP